MDHDCNERIARSIERTAAEGVQHFQIEGMAGSALPIEQQVAADRYLASKRAARHPLKGIALTQIIPGPSR